MLMYNIRSLFLPTPGGSRSYFQLVRSDEVPWNNSDLYSSVLYWCKVGIVHDLPRVIY